MNDISLAGPGLDHDVAVEAAQPSDFRGLHYPWGRWTPTPDALFEVAPGVSWLRMPLSFELSHINLWVLDDGDGWTLVDCGLANETCKGVWRALLAGPLAAKPVKRVIATHFHPDHLGLAGWLVKKTGADLLMTRTEYLMAAMLSLGAAAEVPEAVVDFYRRVGWPDEGIQAFRARGWAGFSRVASPLPIQYRRLQHGDALEIGGHGWRVHVGRGHSPEHAALVCESLGVIISGDQLLPRITSNVSVFALEPNADPLGDWMTSLEALRLLPDELLVLPSHNEPFRGLRARCDQLLESHEAKLARLLDFCSGQARTAYESFYTLFGRPIGHGDIMMASGEALAHFNYLLYQKRMIRDSSGPVDRYIAV